MTDQLLKVEGAGNDFVLGTGEWAARLAADGALARRLCDRRRGIGADGTLAVERRAAAVAGLVYRNADGGEAAFCANGTRCAARAAVELLGLPRELVVETGWGPIPAVVAGGQVGLELPAVAEAPRRLVLAAVGRDWSGWWWRVGVPHLVVSLDDDVDAFDLERVGPALRHHPELAPEGANVNVVAAVGADRIAVRSWERGVEGETLSCGSGVVAAALLWMAVHGGRRLACLTRSGEVLEVAALASPPGCVTRLTGAARFVAALQPTPELLAGLH